jgi:hypothetical protein
MASVWARMAALQMVLAMTGAAGQDAAPSSHMTFQGADFPGDILINELRVPKNGEAMYTFYEALGWGGKASGYAGIQAHPRGHNYIFSIWDHKEHMAPIRAAYHGAGTRSERFGGEGTGLKSWNFELGWDTDVWYTLVARCWPVADHTFYGYWVRSGKTQVWTHLVTMDVATKDAYFRGSNDSFLEDWLETGQNLRTTHLRKGWKRKVAGAWHAFASARYSVNPWDLEPGKRSFNFAGNWNGGVARDASGEFYFMTAGGQDTKPSTTNPSTHRISRTETAPDYAPIRILTGTVSPAAPGSVKASWTIDAKALPQFSYAITAHDSAAAQGAPLVSIQANSPEARSALSTAPAGTTLHWQLHCQDILGNTATFFLQPTESPPSGQQ